MCYDVDITDIVDKTLPVAPYMRLSADDVHYSLNPGNHTVHIQHIKVVKHFCVQAVLDVQRMSHGLSNSTIWDVDSEIKSMKLRVQGEHNDTIVNTNRI